MPYDGNGKKKRKLKKALKRTIKSKESSKSRKKVTTRRASILAAEGRTKAKKQVSYLRPKKKR